jgi:cytochrome d ubiquinol oxidase subunit II
MTFQVIWFILWGVLWAVYFLLDGFDFGVGMLYFFLGKNEKDKAAIRGSIGPVWDGNEVWLITAGGATFAAFPGAYAALFSFLYTALLLVLFALIVRGVSMEFRAKSESSSWKRFWDAGIAAGGFLPALLFGVTFGNLFRGLPIDSAGYHGGLLSLLNPYGLLTGVLFVVSFSVHGALWLADKTEGDLRRRSLAAAVGLWYVLAVVAAAFYLLTFVVKGVALPRMNLLVPLAALFLIDILRCAKKGRPRRAFLSSGATVVLTTLAGIAGIYPNLVPSRFDPASSLTIFNSSSSPLTLKIMTGVALVFVPVVIGYQVWVYRVFRPEKNDGETSPGMY